MLSSGAVPDDSAGYARVQRVAVYRRIEAEITQVLERLGGLPAWSAARDTWTRILYAEVQQATAMAGSTMDPWAVELMLGEGVTYGRKQPREYLMVLGYAYAARWVYDQVLGNGPPHGPAPQGPPVTVDDVRRLNDLALRQAWEPAVGPEPGRFRRNDIGPLPSGIAPPSASEVPAAMREWARSAAPVPPSPVPSSPAPIEDLAIAHAALQRVHPFPDGNGRTGLLVLNLQLMRSGYPPAFIHGRARHAYLRGLREADSGDHARLAGVIARSVLDNLTRFVPREVATTRELLPLSELTTESVDIKVLQRAIRSGKLKAARGSGRGYLSSRAWVAEYLRIRRKRT